MPDSAPTQRDRYIVCVSAMEGQFYRFKTANHPHTNMAKASLNMMVKTSAADYAKARIYMTAVDTGWINEENPVEIAVKTAARHNFQTPIDEVCLLCREEHVPRRTDKRFMSGSSVISVVGGFF